MAPENVSHAIPFTKADIYTIQIHPFVGAYLHIVLFFPQMKPEKSAKGTVVSAQEDYLALGIPAEWIKPLMALGYDTIAKLKEMEKPGKLANDLNGYKKKNKLELPGLSPEVVAAWIK